MKKFVIYKISEWSGEADYFVRFTDEGRKFYGYIGDAKIMELEKNIKELKKGN